jgi:hypothetical protein
MSKQPHTGLIAGESYGRLTVLEYSHKNVRNETYWRCRCVCGNVIVTRGAHLTCGQTSSCGCLHKERQKASVTKHGNAANYKLSATYVSWRNMIGRCKHQSTNGFKYYGGRGITVCERWSEFSNFLADVGERPEGKTLDRINPNGNYEPSNCRWATVLEQLKNRRPKHEP